MLEPGTVVPKFRLKNQNNVDVFLDCFRGEKVFLYFYPKAGTPACTAQAGHIRDLVDSEKISDIKFIGISSDTPQVQKKFDHENNLKFDLLSDPDHKIAKQYEVWGERLMYGKKYMGIIRSSYLIDEEGKVLHAWEKISPAKTVPELLKFLAFEKE